MNGKELLLTQPGASTMRQATRSLPIAPHASPHLSALPPLALYIHIPWCVKKCPYCDFNSHEIPRQPITTTELRYASAQKSPRPRSRPGASHAESRGHFNSHEIRAEPGDTSGHLYSSSPKSPRPRSRPDASHAESRGHFNSHEARGAIPEPQYVEALTADLEEALPPISGRTIHSVFFGGGTPSVFQAESIGAILTIVRARLPLEPGAEVTLEANPGTFEAAKFAAYRAAGTDAGRCAP